MGGHDPRGIAWALVAGLAILFASCSPRGIRQWTAPLIDSPPAPAAAEPLVDPPEIPTEPHGDVEPALVKQALERASHTEEVSAAIRDAEDRFQTGRQLLFQGEAERAQEEFDRAIDLLLETSFAAWDRHRAEEKCEQLIEAIYALGLDERKTEEREAAFEDSPLDDVLSATFPVDPSLPVSDNVKLPASDLPLEVNGAVMKYIRYFSSGRGRKILINGLQRQGRYREMIQRILDEEGLPQELIFLAQAESGFRPRAMSRKRAAGIWQFVRFRGREYGLAQTTEYDDRLDPEKATRAAARHVRDLYEEYGDWYLTMVAYNAGPGWVTRARRRTKQEDFWEFCRRRAIPRETQNYVPIILAMTIMAKNPREYGLEDVVPDPPLEYNTIHVREATHLALIADILDKPFEEIRELNPAILRDVAPSGYGVHVPKGTGGFVMAALETVPPGRRASWRVHRLGQGQTLAEIARLYRTTEQSILMANGGEVDSLETGDLMLIPVSYPTEKAASGAQPVRRRVRRSSGTPTASMRLSEPERLALAP
jgi:membrane-bound lytic murein transglycosylase D